MSTYKVPQDVEADDKLLGPFSFRQFVYLMIVAASGAATWALWGLGNVRTSSAINDRVAAGDSAVLTI